MLNHIGYYFQIGYNKRTKYWYAYHSKVFAAYFLSLVVGIYDTVIYQSCYIMNE